MRSTSNTPLLFLFTGVALAACGSTSEPPQGGVGTTGGPITGTAATSMGATTTIGATGATGTAASSMGTAATVGVTGASVTGASTTGATTTGNTVTAGVTGATTMGATTTDGSGGALSTNGDGTSSGGANTDGASTTAGGNTEPCTSDRPLTAGDSAHSLTVGGNAYPFNVHAPPSYDGIMRIPVVFDFHGLGGNEDQMINLSGWADTGDAEGFITVFPGGVDNAWNAGGCCSDTPTDVDFVREAIAYLDSEGCIDTKRIYASGCSNGGAMSYRLACEAADVIAAVAPVDFDCVVGGGCGSCLPSRPIAEIQFRGTNDSLVPFSGAEPNFERWGEINMCSGSPEPLPENSSCQRQPMCADGVESILCTVQNGSHCGSYNSFGIAPLAWQIISRYSLP